MIEESQDAHPGTRYLFCFSNDFQVPANRIQQDGFRYGALPAKLAALIRLKAAVANVLKVCR